MKMPPHLVLIEPISTLETEPLRTETSDQAYTNSGWVRAVGALEEDVRVGDMVVFVGYKERNIELDQYRNWGDDLYTMHEDDIEAVVEDW